MSLDALLSEASVTKAARRLSLSQPTLSASLAKLRRFFDDELLCRQGNRYVLTPLAESLLPMTRAALAGAERVVTSSASFDPTTTAREFTIVTSEYGASVIGPPLSRMMHERAPNARLRLTPDVEEFVHRHEDMLRVVDGIFMPHGYLEGLPHADLLHDEWVCILSRRNSLMQDDLALADLARLPWVVALFGRSHGGHAAMKQIENLELGINVQVTVQSLLTVPAMVSRTDRVAIVQRSLVRPLLDVLDLRIARCPIELVPLLQAFWWHPSHTSDPAHAWLVQCCRDAARGINDADAWHRQLTVP